MWRMNDWMDEQEREILRQEVLLGEGERRGRRERSQSQGGRESFYIKDQVEKEEEGGGRGEHRIQEEMLERWEVNLERVLQVPREEDNSGGREGAAVKNAAK